MSAIFGYWQQNGRLIEEGAKQKFFQYHKSFGTDYAKCTDLSSFMMGQCIFFCTTRHRFESQPCSHPAHPDLFVAGNIRLDYLPELYNLLGLRASDCNEWSDSRLFLEAYLRFGKDVGKYVHGDYAVAIWDNLNKTLFLIRDRLGHTCLYYSRLPGGNFAFSTHLSALLEILPAREIDEKGLSDFILDWPMHPENTILRGIGRLPVGHFLIAREDSVRVQRYETYEFGDTHYASAGDCSDHFAELLENAVKSRLDCIEPVAASLSGGLDSTTTCFLINKLQNDKLLTLSNIQADGNERQLCDIPFIHKAVESGNFDPVYLDPDPENYQRFFWESQEATGYPHLFYNIGLLMKSWKEAEKRGCRLYFEGFGGDTITSYGTDSYNLLFSKGRINRLHQHAKLAEGYPYIHYGKKPSRYLLRYTLKRILGTKAIPLQKYRTKSVMGRFRREIEQLEKELFNKQYLPGKELQRFELKSHLMYGNMLSLTELLGDSPIWIVSPFTDFKLISFAAGIPDSIREVPRKPRWLYEAFRGTVPDFILDRKTKGDYSNLLKPIWDQPPFEVAPELRELFGIDEKAVPSAAELTTLKVFSRFYDRLRNSEPV